MMKKLIYAVGAMALMVVAGPATADIVGSRHDLTTATGGAWTETGDTDEVCVFCHTPHGGNNTGAPLWNRSAPAGPFTMYNAAFSPTIDMTVAATPQGVSAACLSCHDGVTTFDSLINGPTTVSGTYNYTAGGADQGWTWNPVTEETMADAADQVTNIGTVLTDDHPISVTYDDTQDSGNFFTLAAVQASTNVQLYGASENQVECASCHDPHLTTNVPFLRVSNAASAICTTCHDK